MKNNSSIPALFFEQVQRSPQETAVQYLHEKISYSDLNDRVNQFANYLLNQGVTPGQLIGICLDRSLELIITILGVLKAGAAYVPIDPAYPVERINFLIRDSGVKTLVTSSSIFSSSWVFNGVSINWDHNRNQIESMRNDNPSVDIKPDDLAYVMYTSGSTGNPKGVMVQHSGWLNYIPSAVQTYQLKPGERVLQFASISWDTSAEEIFPCLCSGAALILRPEEMIDSIPGFIQKCSEYRVTLINIPTAFWHELVNQLEHPHINLPEFLRVLIIGGEKAQWQYLEKFYEFSQDRVKIFNTYGQTECTAVTTCVELVHTLAPGIIPIGSPVSGVNIYVLNEQLLPVDDGSPGELLVGGAGLARGYLNQPELTAQKFIEPIPGLTTERLYRTGDLVRRIGGSLEFVGRIDQQVKIRGIRIEPGEIEAVLVQHPSVARAAVVGFPRGASPEYLAAFVELGTSSNVKPSDLSLWLRDRLPVFMVPALIIPLDNLPLTPSGKIDRRSLPEPDFTPSQISSILEQVQTPVQAGLIQIWADVLGIKSIGLQDNFFEIGGHSLLATRVIARVRQKFNVDLTIRMIFDTPTIAGLAELISSLSPASQVIPLTPRQPSDLLVPAFSQEMLWYLDQMEPGNLAYNITDAFQLKGDLQIPLLEKAINKLVERHEVLRMRFEKIDGQPIPVIENSLHIPLRVEESPQISQSEQPAFVRKFASEQVMQSFDLKTGPLIRAVLLKINNSDHVLVIVTHHIISDGWSITLFFHELASLYTQLVLDSEDNTGINLPQLKVQFLDYAIWQRKSLQGYALQSGLNYWLEKLKDISPLEFPLDYPRQQHRSFRGSNVPIQFSKDFSDQIKQFCQENDITLFMLLLAGMQAVLYRYTGQTDISIGTAVANRSLPELDDLIGFFVNTMVLRTSLDGRPTFQELLLRVKETTLDAYANQSIPFELIVKELHPVRIENRNPLFDVMLFLQNVPPEEFNIPGLQTQFVELEQRTTITDLVIDLTETAAGIKGFCEYSIDLFEPVTIQLFVHHFQNIIWQGIHSPFMPVAEIDMLDASERRKLLEEWNDNYRPLPEVLSLPALFENQVLLTPLNDAVIFNSRHVSYSDLNNQANQLAEYLLNRGVTNGHVVAVFMERSLDSLIAILGILKTGAAFLPLDPNYPRDRLEYILQDSQTRVLLTNINDLSALKNYQAEIVRFGSDITFKLQASLPNPIRREVENEPAYLIYTSGSTGRPKGVIGLHAATINRLNWMWQTYPFKTAEVCCQKTSLSFVDSIWEIFGPLLQGVPLLVIPDSDLKDTRLFVELLSRYHVTRLVLVPSLLRSMLETVDNISGLLPDLHTFVSSGEALTVDIVSKFFRNFGSRRLINLYGSSEVSADSTCYEISANDQRISIGKPIFNTQIYLLDDSLQPVPVGVTGEIYVGGAGLSRGYWNKPDLTKERFIPDPFNRLSDSLLFKTGDLGRYWRDGNIEYLGRRDHQVKIRGYRVELDEIQNVLFEHPAVNQALVIADRTADSQRLVAYIEPQPDSSINQAILKKFLAERLPEYMVPFAWVFMDSLPLTASGKIDRLALPLPFNNQADTFQPFESPHDELELKLVKLWERLLEYSPISINDNFFEIGGHSLLVVRLVTELEKELGKPLSLALIFHAPTISAMAATLRKDGWKPTWSSLVPIRTAGSLPPLFCVHADGGAFFYVRFANYLPPEQPFYGLQARGLDGLEPPFSTVEDMARHYINEIRSVQPAGPYLISGFSMGGVVIYEMAKQLKEMGEKSLVIFLDASSPIYPEFISTRGVRKIKRLFDLNMEERTTRLLHRLEQRGRWLVDEILSRYFLLMKRTLTPALRIHRIRELNQRIADEYVPATYDGDAVILWASEQPAGAKPDRTLGWGGFITSEIKDYEIIGNHESIFREPLVGTLARQLQASIDEWLANQKNN